MDIEKVRDLVRLVEDSDVEELELTHGETTIRIRKSSGAQVVAAAVQPVVAPVPATVAPAAEVAAAPPTKWKDVRSPIVGTFYRAPSPTSEFFVNVGDHVSAGQPLCIIEAMKVMNEIEAEFGGTVKEILVENGSPVEAEAVLFLVDPD
ncbi:MAG: acetyl-CoA carboxylase biotin carboxyl carrier protein [bacterium]|nr:acetyl-CoA carboxylase biotin carboxyl carrier protein [bacterium]